METREELIPGYARFQRARVAKDVKRKAKLIKLYLVEVEILEVFQYIFRHPRTLEARIPRLWHKLCNYPE
jgi:hypothetical protein